MADAEPLPFPKVRRLHEYWERQSHFRPSPPEEWMADNILLDALGLGIEQTASFFNEGPCDFAGFCNWILATAGRPDPLVIARYHAMLDGAPPPPAIAARLAAIDAMPDALDAGDLAHWEVQGYVILRGAITPAEAAAAADLLWETIGGDPADPATWHSQRGQGMMVQRFQHPALDAVRRSARVHKAFAQLWGTSDLWPHVDRMSFNAPLAANRGFTSPRLHWDVSLIPPIPYGMLGVLYLTDTAEDQGAFELVPGFHHGLAAWLESLGGADPRKVDLSSRAVRVAAGAGDLIIWRHDLPHGASPNRTDTPRLAQYVTFYSAEMAIQPEWR
ncbi:phytanoyl-CoA dioxygenase family protein [Sphingomonas sp. Sphisp140]|uniref:phytanoyl-CoA dioxygenase family protein n=1 Tax=unclassified Sphingomonas TaxID=196159 RepID=UPI0039AED902